MIVVMRYLIEVFLLTEFHRALTAARKELS
jgi:hypothetical protein